MKLRNLTTLTVLLMLALLGCSSGGGKPDPQPNPNPQEKPKDYTYLAVIDINATQSKEQLASNYQGDVLVYHPDDGFAIVGLSSKPEANSFESLKENGLYSTVYGSGFSAWAGVGVPGLAAGVPGQEAQLVKRPLLKMTFFGLKLT